MGSSTSGRRLPSGDEPVVGRRAAEHRPHDQDRRADEPEDHGALSAAQRARRRPHSSQCAGASGGSFLMRSTSTAERLRWQPPHDPPTSRAMAMPPERFRSSSYSARSSASTSPTSSSRSLADPLELAVDRHLLLGDLRPEGAAPLVERGTRRGEPGQLPVERLDLLHHLELLVLELGDPTLQRGDLVLEGLELARVADRAAVEGLVVVVGPIVERGDLVLEPLLVAAQAVARLLELGRAGLQGRELAP